MDITSCFMVVIFLWITLMGGTEVIYAEDKQGVQVNNYNVKNHYDKIERLIPMRDGTKLFTAVYSPKDRSKTYPILLFRTPYSIKAYGDDFPPLERMAPAFDLIKEGYVFVYQDMRGTYQSEGDLVIMRPMREDKNDEKAIDESTDNYDTIEWLINNIKGHNNKVGQWGISYSAWSTVMGMIDPHPALVASSPQASPADMFIGDDLYHNGAFRLMYAFFWLDYTARKRPGLTTKRLKPFNYGTPWGYEFFMNAGPTAHLNDKYFGGEVPDWDDVIGHSNYDSYWAKRSVLPHLNNIKHPILNVAGWFDAEDFYGPLSIYQEIEQRSPDNLSTLIIGPWRHGGWRLTTGQALGDMRFDSKTSEYFQKYIAFPFFEYHLKGKGQWDPTEAVVFETGNNLWHHMKYWPPKASRGKNIYFHENGKLSFDMPKENTEGTMDTYIGNPMKPVPFSNEIITTPGHDWMVEDQRITSTRPDVLTYKTDVLTEDITIAGPIMANLFLSTSGTDADYFVKLIDVFPGNAKNIKGELKDVQMGSYHMLIGVEVMRAKFRESMSDPKPLMPNKITPLNFKIWDKFHTFKKGHRIMVQIHSSWFPAYDRNPQQFMNIHNAEEKDFKSATHNIFRSKLFPSHVTLPIFERSANLVESQPHKEKQR